MRVFLPVVLLCIGCPRIGAEEPTIDKDCALVFRIPTPDGQPGGPVLAELLDASGKVVKKIWTEGGIGRVCDFDFGVYSLRVGPGWCVPTVLTNLRVMPGYPLALTVFPNDCGSRPDHGSGCSVYARIANEEGTPIGGAEVSAGKWNRKADKYGRVLFGMGRSATARLRFSAEGFQPVDLTLSCKDLENIERKVVLKRIP